MCLGRQGFSFDLMNKIPCSSLPTYNHFARYSTVSSAVSYLGNGKRGKNGREEVKFIQHRQFCTILSFRWKKSLDSRMMDKLEA